MIAFGCSITDPELYRRYAEPGIRLAAEPNSEILAYSAAGSLFRSYNLLMERAAQLEGLEALVLVHQDAEITDRDFVLKLRAAIEDPDVGVVGCVGALGVRSIAWWEGSVTWASFTHRYEELGGGELPAFAWDGRDLPGYAHIGEVDTVDGFVLCLTPWTLAHIRFDESLGQLHGYDLDLCLQVRAAGHKVATADFKVIHHHSLELVGDPEGWIQAHERLAEKWDGRMPGVGTAAGDWRQRARRAEAEAAYLQAKLRSEQLKAHAAQLRFDRQLGEITTSTSWRMTKPLRELGLRLRAAQSRAR